MARNSSGFSLARRIIYVKKTALAIWRLKRPVQISEKISKSPDN
jgi:hypothetical protein